jgi:crotonobetainyl-CoA:carnitine CoA-transferase CaiB-like acyl-CoA transferase
MQPFSGLKVIELASVLAGPTVGLFFAELGADVIKVENKTTGGDVTRNWKTANESEGISAYYSSANWNKQILFKNLKDEQDRSEILDLLHSADILITNFKFGDAEKFGFAHNLLKTQFPKLIVGEIGGFSIDKTRVAYDVVLQAETGFMSMNGTAESGPVKIPVAMMDLLAAHQLKEGLLVALLQRGKTGVGSNVVVTLEDAGISSLANQASNYLMNGNVAKPIGSLHPNIAPYGDTFKCLDNKPIVLAIGSDVQFAKLCLHLGKTNLATDNKFQDNQSRLVNRKELQEELSTLFASVDRDRFLEILHKDNVPAAAIKDLKEVLDGQAGKKLVLEETIENTLTRRVKTVAFTITQ